MDFKVIVEDYEPYLNVKASDNGSIEMNGPLADLFNALALMLNFNYSLCSSVDSTWGSRRQNGTWTGMIGMLRRNEADVALGPFSLTYSRWKAVPTSVPFSVDYAKILMKARRFEMSLFSLYQVFSWEVWLTFFVMSITVAVVLYLNDRIPKRKGKKKGGYFAYLWSLLGILLAQSDTRRPKGTIQHMMKFFWDFPVMILTLLLCMSFLSLLMIQKVRHIETIEDLAGARSIQPIIEKGSSMVNFFKGSNLPAYKTIYNRIKKNPEHSTLTVKDLEEKGMDLVASGKFAILKDASIISIFLAKRHKKNLPCDFYLSTQSFRTLWKVMAFSPRFPKALLKKINKILTHVMESNWLEKRFDDESQGYKACLFEHNDRHRALSLDDVIGTFLILLVGFVIASIALAVDFIKYRHCKKKRRSKKDNKKRVCPKKVSFNLPYKNL